MHTLTDFLATEVTIKGPALDAFTGFNSHIARSSIQKSVKFRAKVRYPHQRGVDTYDFPLIVSGNADEAKNALAKLWKQRALTERQHALLGNAIELAQTFSL